jgi:hypothetical protein
VKNSPEDPLHQPNKAKFGRILWVQNCLGMFFFRFGFFRFPVLSVFRAIYLQHFGAGTCHFNGTTFWSSNLSFSMATILVLELSMLHIILQHFGV